MTIPPGSRARGKIIPFKGSFCQACEPNIKLLFLKIEIDKIFLKCANSSYLDRRNKIKNENANW